MRKRHITPTQSLRFVVAIASALLLIGFGWPL
jgi:hypothetical protein